MNSCLQNSACPHTLTERPWEGARTVICIFTIQTSRPAIHRQHQTTTAVCVCTDDRRLHISVIIQHGFTSFVIHRSTVEEKQRVHCKLQTCGVPVIHTNLSARHTCSRGWVPQALGQSSCNTQGWKSRERVSRVTLSFH